MAEQINEGLTFKIDKIKYNEEKFQKATAYDSETGLGKVSVNGGNCMLVFVVDEESGLKYCFYKGDKSPNEFSFVAQVKTKGDNYELKRFNEIGRIVELGTIAKNTGLTALPETSRNAISNDFTALLQLKEGKVEEISKETGKKVKKVSPVHERLLGIIAQRPKTTKEKKNDTAVPQNNNKQSQSQKTLSGILSTQEERYYLARKDLAVAENMTKEERQKIGINLEELYNEYRPLDAAFKKSMLVNPNVEEKQMTEEERLAALDEIVEIEDELAKMNAQPEANHVVEKPEASKEKENAEDGSDEKAQEVAQAQVAATLKAVVEKRAGEEETAKRDEEKSSPKILKLKDLEGSTLVTIVDEKNLNYCAKGTDNPLWFLKRSEFKDSKIVYLKEKEKGVDVVLTSIEEQGLDGEELFEGDAKYFYQDKKLRPYSSPIVYKAPLKERMSAFVKKHKKGIIVSSVAVIAVAVVATVATLGSCVADLRNKNNDAEAVIAAENKAAKDAEANFKALDGKELLIYQDARTADKVPTGVADNVLNAIKKVSYTGVVDGAKEAYNSKYSEEIGKYVGKAIVSEIYLNSYDWMRENVLQFNDDGTLKKDENSNVVIKDYVFEKECSANAVMAEDFEVGYEAGFEIQLGKELSGNEIIGGSSITKPDEEQIAAVNSATWKVALMEFLKNNKNLGLENKNQIVESVTIADSGDMVFVKTGDALYKVEFAKDGNNLLDENGNIAKINEANADGLINASTCTGNWQTFESAVKPLLAGGQLNQKFVDKRYEEAKEKFGLKSNDTLQICIKTQNTGKKGTAKVDVLYFGTKDGKMIEETENKIVVNEDGGLVKDSYAAVIAVIGDSSKVSFNYSVEDVTPEKTQNRSTKTEDYAK